MGQVVSLITRPLKNYNIEARAHKIISKEKPTPAPKHQATVAEINRLKEEYPDAESKLHEKNEELLQRLRDVYVKSFDPESTMKKLESKSSKILPLNRSQVEEFEYGFKEPDVLTPGKVTLRQALQFISDYQMEPKESTIEKISEKYNIKLETTKNILEYFRMYQVHIPTTADNKKTSVLFATPVDPLRKLLKPKEEEKS